MAISLMALVLAGCESSPSEQQQGEKRCEVSRRLVPTCGVWLGVSAHPPTLQRLQHLEDLVGRNFGVVYHYHDIDDDLINADERAQAARGAVLHLAIAARVYGSAKEITYADIADGRYDATLGRQAREVADFGKPVFLTFEQEASSQRKLDVRGSAAEFRAAWQHLHGLYEHNGADNAVWVWVMTGAEQNLDRSGSLWPGNDVVDWISWNAYNGAQCSTGQIDNSAYRTFGERVAPFYDWVHQTGPSIGIDPNKPMMISELGSVIYPDDPTRTADWYAEVPAALKEYPQIKAIQIWNSTGQRHPTCDFRFDTDPKVVEGVRRLAHDPLMRTTD